jgi:hypothetical protein
MDFFWFAKITKQFFLFQAEPQAYLQNTNRQRSIFDGPEQQDRT